MTISRTSSDIQAITRLFCATNVASTLHLTETTVTGLKPTTQTNRLTTITRLGVEMKSEEGVGIIRPTIRQTIKTTDTLQIIEIITTTILHHRQSQTNTTAPTTSETNTKFASEIELLNPAPHFVRSKISRKRYSWVVSL